MEDALSFRDDPFDKVDRHCKATGNSAELEAMRTRGARGGAGGAGGAAKSHFEGLSDDDSSYDWDDPVDTCEDASSFDSDVDCDVDWDDFFHTCKDTCRYCKATGHMVAACPKLEAKRARDARGDAFSFDWDDLLVTCRYCKATGHTVTACPKLADKRARAARGGAGGGGGAAESHFDGPSYKFNGFVFKLTNALNLKRPYSLTGRRLRQPLPRAHDADDWLCDSPVESYRAVFVPHVLEELRSSVVQDVERASSGTARPSTVTVRKFQPSKNAENPSRLVVQGSLAVPDEYGPVDLLVLVVDDDAWWHGDERIVVRDKPADQDKPADPGMAVDLGLASRDRPREGSTSSGPESWTIKFVNTHEREIEVGDRLAIFVIGSVVTTKRMYTACMSESSPTLLKSVASATPLPRLGVSRDAALAAFTEPLNGAQQAAVEDIHAQVVGSPASVTLLQGPPGTGKTTTIAALTRCLAAAGKKVLISAPSNKAVQVVARRLLRDDPSLGLALSGVESKVDPDLRCTMVEAFCGDLRRLVTRATEGLLEALGDLIGDKPRGGNRASGRELHNLVTSSQEAAQAARDRADRQLPRLSPELLALQRHGDAAAALLEEAAADPAAVDRSSVDTLVRGLQQSRDSILFRIADDDKVVRQILVKASVVLATLSVCGRSQLQESLEGDVDVLIVDEAGQATEAETLIPLGIRPRHCVLVGDVKQLPATVISTHAARNNFGWSMMHRLQVENQWPTVMLEEQFRMHPDIQAWPSREFYGGRLVPAEAIVRRAPIAGVPAALQPYAVLDVHGREEPSGRSFQNSAEVDCAARLVRMLTKHVPPTSIGIITFYSGQVEALRSAIKLPGLLINTVDGFQGGERDVIIVSFVRANPHGTVGFTRDCRRLNVAVTRAKRALIVLANVRTLESGTDSGGPSGLIADARARGLVQPASTHDKLLPNPAPSRAVEGAREGIPRAKVLVDEMCAAAVGRGQTRVEGSLFYQLLRPKAKQRELKALVAAAGGLKSFVKSHARLLRGVTDAKGVFFVEVVQGRAASGGASGAPGAAAGGAAQHRAKAPGGASGAAGGAARRRANTPGGGSAARRRADRALVRALCDAALRRGVTAVAGSQFYDLATSDAQREQLKKLVKGAGGVKALIAEHPTMLRRETGANGALRVALVLSSPAAFMDMFGRGVGPL